MTAVSQVAAAFGMPSGSTTPITVIRRRPVGSTGISVHPIALSGSTFGWSVSSDAANAILDNYVEGGGNFIQTADHYAGGASERMIGEWMRIRGNRDDIVVASTIGRAGEGATTAADLVRAADASLQRLGTDRLDLLNLHGVREDVSVHESLAAAERLISAGKARAVVANDFSPERLLSARIAAAHLEAPLFVAVHMTYNLVQRASFESRASVLAAAQRLQVMPKHALANGFLTGVYRRRDQGARSQRAALALRFLDKRGQRILAALDRVVADTGEESATIALAWLLSKSVVLAPVVSAGSPKQVRSLQRAVDSPLSREHVLLLDRASDPR